jgi:hypothetical protein
VNILNNTPSLTHDNFYMMAILPTTKATCSGSSLFQKICFDTSPRALKFLPFMVGSVKLKCMVGLG